MTDPHYMPDRPVICPYDSNHSIAQSRFQRHIIKCLKNFQPNYRLCCPYNATHRLPQTKYKEHIAECPDRRFVDPFLYEASSTRGSIVNFEMEDRSIITCEENWDVEDRTQYDLSSLRNFDEWINHSIVRTNIHAPSLEKIAIRNIEWQPGMRAPKGLPEALMMEESGDSAVEDIESVLSFMCMGRGKPIANRNNEQYLEMIGRGRGAGTQKS